MRLYNRKFLSRQMDVMSERRLETRDGIVWAILESQHLCQVKIQGSNKLIIAHYPENIQSSSSWLKIGSSVKILHTSGVRGRIEIVGLGQTIPTPVTGSQFPDLPTSPDVVISGGELTEIFNQPRMAVFVKVGTYRIDNVVYEILPISMLYGDNYKMGDGGYMEEIAGVVAIDPKPPAGEYRYDVIYIGTDLLGTYGHIHYEAGTPSTVPIKPTVAPLHVRLGDYILVDSGTVEIRQDNIGKVHAAPEPTSLVMVVDDDELDWLDEGTNVTVSVLDQYGNAINKSGVGWYLKLAMIQGNGYVFPASGFDYAQGYTGPSSNSFTFFYGRNNLPEDQSVVLEATLEIDQVIKTQGYVILYDEDGFPM
jgi:hypothetical protein